MKTPSTKLEKRVARMIKAQLRDYEGSRRKREQLFLDDLMYGGCQSGMIPDLIYYHDTTRFFKLYRPDIQDLLIEAGTSIGATSPADLFGEKWDKSDPFAREDQNQNLLAWFAFEETARRLLEVG